MYAHALSSATGLVGLSAKPVRQTKARSLRALVVSSAKPSTRASFAPNNIRTDRTFSSRRSGLSFVAKASAAEVPESVLEVDDAKWRSLYMELVQYHEENNHCSIPEEAKNELSNWTREQRHLRHEGTLGDKKIRLLNELRFDWESGAAEWMENYLQVKNECDGAESCSVSRKDDPELGLWVSDQRAARKNNRLSKVRETYLVEIGVFPKDK